MELSITINREKLGNIDKKLSTYLADFGHYGVGGGGGGGGGRVNLLKNKICNKNLFYKCWMNEWSLKKM